jgi:hypothetical protein
MEGYDRLMLRDMFEIVPPNGALAMKEEYREKFADGLKAEIPELFPTVRVIENPDGEILFKGPKTKLTFPFPFFGPLYTLIFNFKDNGFGGEWDYMPFLRHKEIEAKVTNILRKIYREKGQGVRNAQLTGALTGLPHGPESRVASMLSGIEGKNAYQQGDELKRRAGIQGPFPNRKKFSGRRKTLRRKNLRSSRKNK